MHWTIERMMDLATGYWQSGVLTAAVELNLFDALERKAATAEDVAKKLGTAPFHTAELMNALAALGILEKTGGSDANPEVLFRIRPSAAQYLTRSGDYCILDALKFNTDMYPLWSKLSDTVRNGRPALPPGAHLGGDPSRTRRFVVGMHSRALAMAPALIPALDMTRRAKLLDVASGPGTFSAMLADKYPELSVTMFDLPPVLDVARGLVRDRQSAARISFSPGDYHSDPFPSGFDTALYCGALHQEDPESAVAVLKKIYGALEPKGRIYVVDMMLRKGRVEPAFSTLFSLNMMLTSPGGRVFTEIEVREAVAKAGFYNPRLNKLGDCPYWVVTAEK